jgi:hypothetical protein
MKSILIVFTILTLSVNLIAQQWQVEGSELKAEKNNGEIRKQIWNPGSMGF